MPGIVALAMLDMLGIGIPGITPGTPGIAGMVPAMNFCCSRTTANRPSDALVVS
jgi:hypothetical protein